MPERSGDLGLLLMAKALASAIVLALGFRAVSDDDFSRVVLAQLFAVSPKLDPSGSSWLPFPFWLSGSVFLVVGRSLFVARAFAVVLGLVSALLVAFAARRLSTSRTGALAGAVIAAVFPWSARLAVATVPELLTAAFSLYAASLLVGPDPRGSSRLLGGFFIFGATLSRYDAWPVAIIFSLFCIKDAAHEHSLSLKSRVKIGFGAFVSLVGPLGWIVWNYLSHGNAFDFLDRVAAYRRALGEGEDGRFSHLLAYPMVMAKHEPEVFVFCVLLLGAICLPMFSRLRAEALRPYSRPFAIALFQILFLSVALVKDGAPTHHAERAILFCLLLMAVFVGDIGTKIVLDLGRVSRFLVVGSALALLGLSIRFVRPAFPQESFNTRENEVDLGLASAELVPRGERVLVDVNDYGYFAFMAAFARPEDIVLDRDIDPRKPQKESAFQDAAVLRQKAAETRVTFFIGATDNKNLREIAEPRHTSGPLALWVLR